MNSNSGSSEPIVNSTGKKVLAVDAGSTKTIMVVADGIKGGKVLKVYKGGSVLSDRVGQDKALKNLKGLLCSALDGEQTDSFGAACIGISSTANSAQIAEFVQAVVMKESKNGYSSGSLHISLPFKIIDMTAQDRSIVLHGGTTAFCYIKRLNNPKGGRSGMLATVGSGDWISQSLIREACSLSDQDDIQSYRILNSLVEELVIYQRVVSSGSIMGLLRKYDIYKKENVFLDGRLGMIEQALIENHSEVLEYLNGQSVDFSSLVPVCVACAKEVATVERILEEAGRGLAGLVIGAIKAGDKQEEDYYDNHVVRHLIWDGGILENVPSVWEAMTASLKKEVPDIQIDIGPTDSLLGIVKVAQGLVS